MSQRVTERYVHDALNARATLDGDSSEAQRELARKILRDIDIYFADHMDELRDARTRLAERDDVESRTMLRVVDEILSSHADAAALADEAIARAWRG